MTNKLNKGLSLLDVFCIATGAMISSGLFILPGLAFSKAGPAVVLSYLIAGIFCIPTLFSMAELSTAMPKAGGDYFYIMRGFGPLLGTVAGFSTWLSLGLKGSFALLGIGAYLSVFFNLPINIVAAIFCCFFVLLNLIGVREAGRFQVILVIGLLSILLVYIIFGSRFIKTNHFMPFFSNGLPAMFSTASFVFVSYGGLVKIVALAEEVEDPARSLSLGMIFSIIITAILYTLVISVTVGVTDTEVLKGTLTPISDAAGGFGGDIFKFLIGFAAFLAFVTTANASVMTASRYPLGMSRDELLPSVFQAVNRRFKTPHVSILFTGSVMMFAVVFLNLEWLVKVASAVLILLYIFSNLTLILFRESKIESYRPKFHSPFYPYIQIIGILGGGFLLVEMGSLIIFMTGIFLLLGVAWYKFYAQNRAGKDYALIYLLERLVAKDKELASESLLAELKDIVIQRDVIVTDRFHNLIEDAVVLDLDEPVEMDKFFQRLADILSRELDETGESLFQMFIDREKTTSTVIRKGLAIPHIVVRGNGVFKIILVRAKGGIIFPGDEIVHIAFVLVGSQDERNLHLKALAAIAQITQHTGFDKSWFAATNKEDLKNIVLLAERRRG